MSVRQLSERIVLTGFMGAGKSTVGRILAARIGWRFFDTDTLITTQHHLSVAEIFRQHGESRFRDFEMAAVRTALLESDCVIALGGGAIETPAIRELLSPIAPEISAAATLTIYLEAPLAELLARCARPADGHVRPLLAAEDPNARLTRRLPHYRRAHLTIPTQGKAPEGVVEAIVEAIRERIPLDQTHAGTPRSSSTSPIESNPGAAS